MENTQVDATEKKVDEVAEASQAAKEAIAKATEEARTPEQKEILNLMKTDQKFVAVRQIMEVKNRVGEVSAIKDEAISKIREMCPDARLSVIESRACALDEKALTELNMSKEEDWEKVKACYTFEDGTMVHFTSDPDLKDVRTRMMHRDFLLYLKKVKEETEKFDEYEAKMKNEIDDLMKEYENAVGTLEADKLRNYASFADYYREWITNTLTERQDLSDTARNALQKVLDADDAGISLDFLIKEIKALIDHKGDAKSLLWGYHNAYGDVAKKAESVLRTKFAKYKFHIAFTKFYDFEKRVFPGQYDGYNNLFMFIVFRYIKAHYERFDNSSMITLGELLTQLGFLMKPEAVRPEISKKFVESYKAVMALVINH